MDIDSIPGGVDFAQHIQDKLSKRPVVIVLIGKTWLEVTNEAGGRRLDDPQDFVRIEVASALSKGLKVFPVLVAEAKMPKANELPKGLEKLSRLHAREISQNHFKDDVELLIRDIDIRTWARFAPILLGIGLVIGVGSIWFWSNHLRTVDPTLGPPTTQQNNENPSLKLVKDHPEKNSTEVRPESPISIRRVEGYDNNGKDLYHRDGISYDYCLGLCQDNSQCKGFYFVDNKCYLKRELGPLRRKSNENGVAVEVVGR